MRRVSTYTFIREKPNRVSFLNNFNCLGADLGGRGNVGK